MLDGLRVMLLPTMIVPGCIDMLRFLVKNGGGGQDIILEENEDGWTALHFACIRYGLSIDVLRFLV